MAKMAMPRSCDVVLGILDLFAAGEFQEVGGNFAGWLPTPLGRGRRRNRGGSARESALSAARA
jgi:hypothetical protein